MADELCHGCSGFDIERLVFESYEVIRVVGFVVLVGS